MREDDYSYTPEEYDDLREERDEAIARAERAETTNAAITLLLEVPEGGTGWEAIRALRARAEQAEAALRELVAGFDQIEDAPDNAFAAAQAVAEWARANLAATTPEKPEPTPEPAPYSPEDDLYRAKVLELIERADPEPT